MELDKIIIGSKLHIILLYIPTPSGCSACQVSRVKNQSDLLNLFSQTLDIFFSISGKERLSLDTPPPPPPPPDLRQSRGFLFEVVRCTRGTLITFNI